MSKLERYEIDQSANRISIDVDERANPFTNVLISLILVGSAVYVFVTWEEFSAFSFVLLGLGILAFMPAYNMLRSERGYTLTNQKIEYHSTSQTDPKTLSSGNLSHILLKKGNPPDRIGKVLHPWEVEMIDEKDMEYIRAFRFQKKKNAQKLASLISEFYGVEVK